MKSFRLPRMTLMAACGLPLLLSGGCQWVEDCFLPSGTPDDAGIPITAGSELPQIYSPDAAREMMHVELFNNFLAPHGNIPENVTLLDSMPCVKTRDFARQFYYSFRSAGEFRENPLTGPLVMHQTFQFTAQVRGTNENAVAWQVSLYPPLTRGQRQDLAINKCLEKPLWKSSVYFLDPRTFEPDSALKHPGESIPSPR